MLPGANSGMKRIKCGWTQPLFRSKTFAPKILAHTTCINGYWKYTQIFSSINQAKLIAKSGKTYCKNNWAELTAKTIKCWRLPKILLYSQKCSLPKMYAHIFKISGHFKIFASNQIYAQILKYLRIPQNICLHQNICAFKIFAPLKYIYKYINICATSRMFASHNIRQ